VKPVRVTELEVLSAEAWDAALRATGTPYRFSHRAAAGRAFEGAYAEYRFEPCRVMYDDGSVALVPLVRARRRLGALTRMEGMPLGLEGTPVVVEGSLGPGHVHGLFDALDACGRLSLHGGGGGSPPANGSEKHATTHVLDLRPGFEVLWTDSFTSKNRNMVRKAEKRGVEIANETAAGRADTYYDIYADASKKWGYAAPPYPRLLFSALMDSGEAELWIAREEGEAVAGLILLRGSSDVLYWSGATVPGKQELAASNALLSEAIRPPVSGASNTSTSARARGSPASSGSRRASARSRATTRSPEVSSLRYRALEGLKH